MVITQMYAPCRNQDVLSVALLQYFLLESRLELFELHIVAFIFKELHDLVQIDVLTHLLDKMLRPLVQELLEVGSLLDFCIRGLTKRLIVITAPAFIIKASEDLLFDSYDLNQTVLP